MKADYSEASERVLNKHSGFRKIVLSLALAIIMVASAFVVSMASVAETSNPTVYGWTLEPWVGWTEGNIKRYLEGEVVPMKFLIPNPSGIEGDRTIKIMMDYYYESASKKYYGFDTAVSYRWGSSDPSAPYSPGDPSDPVFSIPHVSQGYVKTVTGLPPETIGQETMQIWTVVIHFYEDSTMIDLRTAGLLATSTDLKHGASWYPGASLHFGLEDEGKRTVSVFVDGALSPPNMVVQKSCTPDHVAKDDFMTIQLIIHNMGEADAHNLVVVDKLPMVAVYDSPEDEVPDWVDLVDYVPDSTYYKTSESSTQKWALEPVESTELDEGNPLDPTDDQMFRVLTWNGYPLACHRGTGVDGMFNVLVVTIWFQVQIVDSGERNFQYINYAEVQYDDGHDGYYEPAWDTAPFWVIEPLIEIEKRAYLEDDEKKADLHCAAAPYVSGYPPEDKIGLGDKIVFEITVSNPSLDWDVDQFWVTDSGIAAQQPDYNDDDIIWHCTVDLPHAYYDGAGHLIMYEITKTFGYQITGAENEDPWPEEDDEWVWVNHASVIAKDVLDKHSAVDGADWWIDILHPDAKITKTADIEYVAIVVEDEGKLTDPVLVVSEEITYTFKVENRGDAPLWFVLCDPMFVSDPPYDSTKCEDSFAGNTKPVDSAVPLPAWYDDEGNKMSVDPPSWTITMTWTYALPEPEPLPPIGGGEPEPTEPVIPQIPDKITNTVTLCAWDLQGHKLKRTSTEEVDVVSPKFIVTKRAVDPTTMTKPVPDGKGWVGADMQVLYEITVENKGDSTLYFYYTDSNTPLTPHNGVSTLPYNYDPPYSGELWNGMLAVGGKDTKYWWYTVKPSDIIKTGDYSGDLHVGEVKNTVTVTAWWNNEDEDHRENTLPPQSSTCYVKVMASASGTVFHDVGAGEEDGIPNAYDGDMDSDEVGLANFWVELRYAKETSPGSGVWVEDAAGHGGNSLYKFMMSKATPPSELGDYFFDAILPGDYIVKVLTAPPYPALTPVPPEDYFSTGATRYVLHLAGGDAATDKDFPLAEYSEILGFKWLDRNMNGEWDDDTDVVEAGQNGWTVTLTGHDYDGIDVTKVVQTATIEDPRTDTEPPTMIVGAYYFTEVKPGDYVITETMKDGWFATTPTRIPETAPATFHVVHGELYDKCLNFGNVPMRDVEGYKFYDKDMDGIWDETGDNPEPALKGFTMKLFKVPFLSLYKAKLLPGDYSVYVATAVTDENGYYKFQNVKPGRYMVKETAAPYGGIADWVITNPEDQAFDDLWSPMWFPPPIPAPLVLPDLGNMRYAYITGYHFHDYWGWGETASPFPSAPPLPPLKAPDGVKNQPDEHGMPSEGVKLYKWDDTADVWVLVPNPDASLEWTTYTDVTGKYTLKVVPGKYRIEGEAAGVNWWWTTATSYEFVVPAIYASTDALVYKGNFGHALMCGLDPEIKFLLQKGWNLWSVPMTIPGGLTAASLLDAIGPNGIAVSKLDTSSGEYLMYVVGDGTGDFPIVLGEGYYVFAAETTRFSLIGELVYSSEKDLVTGWNIVGFSELGSMMASELMTHVIGCTAVAVSSLDPVTREYSMYVAGDGPEYDFVVGAGAAYFLFVDGPGQLDIG